MTTTGLRSVKVIEAELLLSQEKLEQAKRAYHTARKAVEAADDEMIQHRESVRKLREELEESSYKELTIEEVSVRDQEISGFRGRMDDVMGKLEAAGTAKIVEPISAWVAANKETARAHADCYVALAFYKGIIISHKDKSTFSIMLANMDAGMRGIVHIFHMSDYLRGEDKATKDKILSWVETNRKRLVSIESFREAALLCSKSLFGNKTPSEDELSYIERVMGAAPQAGVAAA
jgi:hypothetical protein